MADNTKQLARDYEGMFLFGTAATANADEALNTVRGFIEKHGGRIHVLKKWDDRKLAFEVAKQQRGLYVLAYFNAPTTAVAAIDREVRLSDVVLRALITDGSHLTVDEVEAMQPQQPPPPRERSEDDRGFGGGFGGDRGGFGGDRRGGGRREREPETTTSGGDEAGA